MTRTALFADVRSAPPLSGRSTSQWTTLGLEVKPPLGAARTEEHGLGRAVELDHPAVPAAFDAALHHRWERRAAQEEGVEREVLCRVESAGASDLGQH